MKWRGSKLINWCYRSNLLLWKTATSPWRETSDVITSYKRRLATAARHKLTRLVTSHSELLHLSLFHGQIKFPLHFNTQTTQPSSWWVQWWIWKYFSVVSVRNWKENDIRILMILFPGSSSCCHFEFQIRILCPTAKTRSFHSFSCQKCHFICLNSS